MFSVPDPGFGPDAYLRPKYTSPVQVHVEVGNVSFAHFEGVGLVVKYPAAQLTHKPELRAIIPALHAVQPLVPPTLVPPYPTAHSLH